MSHLSPTGAGLACSENGVPLTSCRCPPVPPAVTVSGTHGAGAEVGAGPWDCVHPLHVSVTAPVGQVLPSSGDKLLQRPRFARLWGRAGSGVGGPCHWPVTQRALDFQEELMPRGLDELGRTHSSLWSVGIWRSAHAHGTMVSALQNSGPPPPRF